jgi:hypothetical protein
VNLATMTEKRKEGQLDSKGRKRGRKGRLADHHKLDHDVDSACKLEEDNNLQCRRESAFKQLEQKSRERRRRKQSQLTKLTVILVTPPNALAAPMTA